MKGWRLALGALGALVYARAILARNRSLRPPPVRDARGFAYTPHRYTLSDGEELDVILAGTGAPVLLIPGADGVKETWRYQLPAFTERFHVAAPDLRRSFAPLDTFDRFTDDLAELIDALGTGPVALVGQSLGGAIAMRFAYRFPDLVRALVLSNTLARIDYGHVGVNRTALVPVAVATTRYLPTRLARRAARAWSRQAVWIFDDSPGAEALIDYALWTGPRTVPAPISARRVALLERTDLRPGLGAVRAPTLVVKGPRDSYCPPEWALDIAARVPGARYVTVPGTGHCSHIARPDAFNRVVLGWLEEVLEG